MNPHTEERDMPLTRYSPCLENPSELAPGAACKEDERGQFVLLTEHLKAVIELQINISDKAGRIKQLTDVSNTLVETLEITLERLEELEETVIDEGGIWYWRANGDPVFKEDVRFEERCDEG